MNLGQIRQEIADALSFDPTSSSYDESVIRRVNHVYRQLCSSDPWDFLQKTVDYKVFPDLLGTEVGYDLVWTAGNFKAELTSPVGYGGALFMEGATATDSDSVNHDVGVISVEAGNTFLRTTAVAASTATVPAVVSFDRWRLPADCVDVLGMVNREEQYGPLRGVSEWEENRYPLYSDQRGTPLVFVLEGQRAQEYRGSSDRTGNVSAQFGWEFGQNQFSRPPDIGRLQASPAAGGDLTQSSYEYMLTWVSGGVETGPSQTFVGTTSAGNNSVQITNLPVIGALPGVADYGANKKLYRRRSPTVNNEPGGAWYRLNNGGDGAASDSLGLYSDATTTTDGMIEHLLIERYYEPLPVHYFRLYPKPDRELQLSLRYHYLPPLLEEDRDIPHIPQEFHSLLVHLVVEQIAAQTEGNTLANHHAKMSAALIERMRRRYLTSRSTNSRRKLWGTSDSFLIKPKIVFGGP
tara:strand:- start:6431 stop:7822 length:1392 start_codon:yes stop_codon:yes gene_type:complete